MKFRNKVLIFALSAFIIPTPVHADVEHQGPLSIMTAATASEPAVRVDPPTTTTIPWVDNRSVEQMIRDIWPDNLEERAIRIAYRESRFQCCVHTFCCYGVFQIYLTLHHEWLNDMGIYTKADLYDPLNNVKAAYHLYQLDGWSPWQT